MCAFTILGLFSSYYDFFFFLKEGEEFVMLILMLIMYGATSSYVFTGYSAM